MELLQGPKKQFFDPKRQKFYLLAGQNIWSTAAEYGILALSAIWPGHNCPLRHRRSVQYAVIAAGSGRPGDGKESCKPMKIGITELILVVIVAFVFIGPSQLPEYARKLGKMLRELRQYTSTASKDIQENIVEPLNEIQQPIKEAISPLTDIKKDFDNSVKDVTKSFAGIGKTSKEEAEAKASAAEEPVEELEELSEEAPAAPAAAPAAAAAAPADQRDDSAVLYHSVRNGELLQLRRDKRGCLGKRKMQLRNLVKLPPAVHKILLQSGCGYLYIHKNRAAPSWLSGGQNPLSGEDRSL